MPDVLFRAMLVRSIFARSTAEEDMQMVLFFFVAALSSVSGNTGQSNRFNLKAVADDFVWVVHFRDSGEKCE